MRTNNHNEKQAQLAKERTALYQAVFNSEMGQKVLADLFKYCGMNSTGFVPDSDRCTSYNLGRRDMYYYITKNIKE